MTLSSKGNKIGLVKTLIFSITYLNFVIFGFLPHFPRLSRFEYFLFKLICVVLSFCVYLSPFFIYLKEILLKLLGLRLIENSFFFLIFLVLCLSPSAGFFSVTGFTLTDCVFWRCQRIAFLNILKFFSNEIDIFFPLHTCLSR